MAAASALQEVFWWVHLAIILGFAVYIPFSKHIHIGGRALNAYFRSLEPRGTLETIDLENAERFWAGRCPGLHLEATPGRVRLRRMRPLL